jgi:hypothetical protein
MKVGDKVELLITDIGNITGEVYNPVIAGKQGVIVEIDQYRDLSGHVYRIKLENCGTPLYFADTQFKVIEEVINNE